MASGVAASTNPAFKDYYMRTVYLWPDGQWCITPELDEYLEWKSDDYMRVKLTNDEYDQLESGNENILLPYLS